MRPKACVCPAVEARTGTFIGRPVADIVAETASVPTGKNNFFERA